MVSGPWSDAEIEATVEAYLQMLTLELAGDSYVKSEFRRQVERDVDRSRAAIEYKFNNVSAVLDEVGAMWIPGYKPLRNVQSRLRELVLRHLETDSELRSFMLRAVTDTDVAFTGIGVEVDPPVADWPEIVAHREGVLGLDFAAIESANRTLGRAGELAVMDAERARLRRLGRADLADEVEHSSESRGDGLGYDIRSFRGNTDEPAFIEVKTTRFGREVPFFLSENERGASQELGPAYRLLRLYRYGRHGSGYYSLLGPLSSTASLRPDSYRALPAPTREAG